MNGIEDGHLHEFGVDCETCAHEINKFEPEIDHETSEEVKYEDVEETNGFTNGGGLYGKDQSIEIVHEKDEKSNAEVAKLMNVSNSSELIQISEAYWNADTRYMGKDCVSPRLFPRCMLHRFFPNFAFLNTFGNVTLVETSIGVIMIDAGHSTFASAIKKLILINIFFFSLISILFLFHFVFSFHLFIYLFVCLFFNNNNNKQ